MIGILRHDLEVARSIGEVDTVDVLVHEVHHDAISFLAVSHHDHRMLNGLRAGSVVEYDPRCTATEANL